MEANRGCARKSPHERPESGERPHGHVLAEKADRSRDLRLRVAGGAASGELVLPASGQLSTETLQRHAVEEPGPHPIPPGGALQRGELAGRGKPAQCWRSSRGGHEDGQTARKLWMEEVAGTHRRERVGLNSCGCPPGGRSIAVAAEREEGQAEMEVDERAPRTPPAELAQARNGSGRPRGERSPDLCRKSAVAGEDAAGGLPSACAVEPLRAAERNRLGIGSETEVEQKTGRLPPRRGPRRGRLAVTILRRQQRHAERERDGGGRAEGDDQPQAGSRPHPADHSAERWR